MAVLMEDKIDMAILSRIRGGIGSAPICSFSRYPIPLTKRELRIKWDKENKCFFVWLKGKQTNDPCFTYITLDDLACKIPLEVAENSICDCGATLKLGNNSVISKDDDFTFQGEFYCPECNKKRLTQKPRIRDFIIEWLTKLKKIEIKATGVNIEKE